MTVSKQNKSKSRWAVALALLVACPCAALAGGPDCTIESAGVAFGNYNPLTGLDKDDTGQVTVRCSANGHDDVSFTLYIGDTAARGYNPPRELVSPSGDALRYELYTSAARTTPWGDGFNGSGTVNGYIASPRRGKTKSYPIYGRIFGGQNVPVGAYSDPLGVAVVF